MSPNRPPGLGTQTSTRPTREERRREVERVRPEIDEPTTTTTLQPRKKASKVPFNTYVHRSTQQRIEWFKTHGGYTVTDIVEVALNQFLDQQGAPKVSETGELLR
jgi:hypothetical protein